MEEEILSQCVRETSNVAVVVDGCRHRKSNRISQNWNLWKMHQWNRRACIISIIRCMRYVCSSDRNIEGTKTKCWRELMLLLCSGHWLHFALRDATCAGTVCTRCTTTHVAIESKEIIDKNFDYFCVVHALARSRHYLFFSTLFLWFLLNTSAIEHRTIMCSVALSMGIYLCFFSLSPLYSNNDNPLTSRTLADRLQLRLAAEIVFLFHWRDMFD